MRSIQISRFTYLFLLLFCIQAFSAQAYSLDPVYHNLRSNNDLLAYRLKVRINPEKRWIGGENAIRLRMLKSAKAIQLDLDTPMKLTQILLEGNPLTFLRKERAVIVKFPEKIKTGKELELICHFEGHPQTAKKAPWDGGFVWEKDSLGNPWIGLACEGDGASIWFPCKDQWKDEPEKLLLSIEVPQGLTAVGNGRMLGSERLPDAYERFDWEVKNPINHYDITVNVGKYAHIHETFKQASGDLNLDYYVLEYHLEQAKNHFRQVEQMQRCFSYWFGPYPFQEDGYKLVETPYWGMEHQSCVAYGNNFKNNPFGFDFIIVHESGHEWFANSVTASDRSDMWIHEGFTTYSEAVYVECQAGPERSKAYLKSQRGNIKNQYPIVGKREVGHHARDNDQYYKGSWMLHTLRNHLQNDTLWQNALHDFALEFRHKTIETADVIAFFSKRCRQDLSSFFKNYLEYAELPVLEYYVVNKNEVNELHFRLKSNDGKLKLQLQLRTAKDRFEPVIAGPGWEIIDLPYADLKHFTIKPDMFLVEMKERERERKRERD